MSADLVQKQRTVLRLLELSVCRVGRPVNAPFS